MTWTTRTVSLAVALTALTAACDKGTPLAPEPPEPWEVRLTLTLSSPEATTSHAFEAAEQARIVVRFDDRIVLDTTTSHDASRTSLTVRPGGTRPAAATEVTVDVAFFLDSVALFRGTGADLAGDGTIDVSVDVQPELNGVRPAVAIATGSTHACALNVHGQAFCWGRLPPDTTAPPVLAPTLVVTQARFVDIVAGGLHTCARTEKGEAWCWGDNSQGQVGDGSRTQRAEPARVEGTSFKILTAGYRNTCGASDGGTVYCWGGNGRNGIDDVGGPLGFSPPDICPIGDTYFQDVRCALTPMEVVGLSGVSRLDSGLFHTCAIGAGGAMCWGWNALGQIGDPTPGAGAVAHPLPTAFEGLPGAPSEIHAGAVFSCALVSGTPWCRGNIGPGGVAVWDWGQFGDGMQDGQAIPGPASVSTPLKSLAVSDGNRIYASTVCGLSTDGTAFCWGASLHGELGGPAETICVGGQNTFGCRLLPGLVDTDRRFTEIDLGTHYTCGLATDRRVYCWGLNESGQLGDGTTTSRSRPEAVG